MIFIIAIACLTAGTFIGYFAYALAKVAGEADDKMEMMHEDEQRQEE